MTWAWHWFGCPATASATRNGASSSSHGLGTFTATGMGVPGEGGQLCHPCCPPFSPAAGTGFCPRCLRQAGALAQQKVKWHLKVLWGAIALLVPSVVAELLFLCSWHVVCMEEKVAFALHPQMQLSSAHSQPFQDRLRHN